MELSKIAAALATVADPKTGQDLITANMVLHLKVEPPNVSFTLELAQLDSEYKQQLNFACQEAILNVYPKAQVHVHMQNPGGDAGAKQSGGGPQRSNPLPHVRNVIAVASGKGGVGKSTVAINLALGLQELGARVGLLDADVYGPSAPTMLGLLDQKPTVEKVYGKPKIKPLYAYGLPVMSTGFVVEPEQAVVLRGPRLAGIIRQFIEETIWPPLDYLIVDLPPGTGDVQLTLVQSISVNWGGTSYDPPTGCPGRCHQGHEYVLPTGCQRARTRCSGKHVLLHPGGAARQQILPLRKGGR